MTTFCSFPDGEKPDAKIVEALNGVHFSGAKEYIVENMSPYGFLAFVPHRVRNVDGDEVRGAINDIFTEMTALGVSHFFMQDKYMFDTNLNGMGMHIWAGVFRSEADAMVFKLRFGDGE